MNQEGLEHTHQDLFKEIGSIGAGNAATSLSMLLETPIGMSLPQARLVELDQAIAAVGGAESMVYGVLVNLSGDINGMLLFLLGADFARQILDSLTGGLREKEVELDDLALSTIREVGGIVCSAYTIPVAELTGLRIDMSVPQLSMDMAGALLSVPMIQFCADGEKVLLIQGQLTADKKASQVETHLLLFAELDSLRLIIEKLGLD